MFVPALLFGCSFAMPMPAPAPAPMPAPRPRPGGAWSSVSAVEEEAERVLTRPAVRIGQTGPPVRPPPVRPPTQMQPTQMQVRPQPRPPTRPIAIPNNAQAKPASASVAASEGSGLARAGGSTTFSGASSAPAAGLTRSNDELYPTSPGMPPIGALNKFGLAMFIKRSPEEPIIENPHFKNELLQIINAPYVKAATAEQELANQNRRDSAKVALEHFNRGGIARVADYLAGERQKTMPKEDNEISFWGDIVFGHWTEMRIPRNGQIPGTDPTIKHWRGHI